jgi:YVTN family beta-propeller protein
MVARRVFVALPSFFLAALFARAALIPPEPAEEEPRYKSPLGLAVDPAGQFAYVALHTADALAVVDLKDRRVLAEIPVGRKPYDVALFKGIAYVTCEADDTLVAVDLKTRRVKQRFKVGQAPRGVSIDPQTGRIRVVCHDEKVLWTQTADGKGAPKKEPLPPQPEGNYARATNLDLLLGKDAFYRHVSRPSGLFTPGQSIFDPPTPPAINVGSEELPRLKKREAKPPAGSERTAFNPALDLDTSVTGMDLVAHTRPRWFVPMVSAPDRRMFTNAFSFFLNSSTPAAVVLLDEPTRGYPDPTDVVVKLPKQLQGKKALPLAAKGTADTHPLKGARVFISSGGADTVVVLDLHKAAKHVEATPRMPPASSVGFGGWGTSFNGGGNFGSGFSGSGFRPGSQIGFGGGNFGFGGGTFGGGGNGGLPPGASSVPFGFSGFGGSPFGGSFGGGFSGFGGWQGGFSGFREDLHASARYTLARLPTQANPRRMALTPDGKTLVVSNYLADSLTLIDAD